MKSDRAYLEHVLHCVRRVLEDSSPGRQAVFASPTLQDAILRNLPVLCESAQRLTERTRERHPEVDWRAMAGLRNVLVHDYFSVDLETIWTIIQLDLPVLGHAVSQLLEDPSVT